MCGIAGFVGNGGKGDLLAMGDALIHRGPDGSGTCIEESRRVFLIHRRLSVLDVQGGGQPMWNEDGSICVVFNGEIYNHLELRRVLVSKGHIFKSDHSDTEVLVHGYEEWGDDLPSRLNGMFAFAIFDRNHERLFLARDRFGKKPLYYTVSDGSFVFASELKALLKHGGVEKTVDKRSLQKFFAYGFIPAPNSLYLNVAKLPGGHSLAYDFSSGKATKTRYWQFKIEPHEHVPDNPEKVWGEELRHLLSQAVKRRLISDVPLGIFLSGGIDSSAVLLFASQHVPAGKNQTFSIGFHEPSYDESGYARHAADLIGSDHRERILDIESAKDLIPEVLARLDEPLGDSSILPTYLLCKFAREHVTVALGGDGGDELFAGYDTFKALNIAKWYSRWVPRRLHRGLRSLAEMLPKSDRNMSLDLKIRRGLRGVSWPESAWNPAWLGALEPDEIEDLFNEPTSHEELYEEAISAWTGSTADNIFDRTLEFYTRFYLQDDILAKIDRASMMVSLEVRAPFLDNDVVEFARRIPRHFKYRHGVTKYLLKKSLEDFLPRDILYRKKKGFGIPLADWMRKWDQPRDFSDMPRFNSAWVDEKWSEHRNGRADHRQFLWCWIALRHHFSDHIGN